MDDTNVVRNNRGLLGQSFGGNNATGERSNMVGKLWPKWQTFVDDMFNYILLREIVVYMCRYDFNLCWYLWVQLKINHH